MKDLNKYEDKVLELIDNQNDFTRSDLQGVVSATVHEIYNADRADLIEALEGLLDMVTDNRTHGQEVDAACEALVKARGTPGAKQSRSQGRTPQRSQPKGGTK